MYIYIIVLIVVMYCYSSLNIIEGNMTAADRQGIVADLTRDRSSPGTLSDGVKKLSGEIEYLQSKMGSMVQKTALKALYTPDDYDIDDVQKAQFTTCYDNTIKKDIPKKWDEFLGCAKFPTSKISSLDQSLRNIEKETNPLIFIGLGLAGLTISGIFIYSLSGEAQQAGAGARVDNLGGLLDRMIPAARP